MIATPEKDRWLILWNWDEDDFIVVSEAQEKEFPNYHFHSGFTSYGAAIARMNSVSMRFMSPEDLEELEGVTPRLRQHYVLTYIKREENLAKLLTWMQDVLDRKAA